MILSGYTGTPADCNMISVSVLALCHKLMGFNYFDDDSNLPHHLPVEPSIHGESLKLNEPKLLTKLFSDHIKKSGNLPVKLFSLSISTPLTSKYVPETP